MLKTNSGNNYVIAYIIGKNVYQNWECTLPKVGKHLLFIFYKL